MIIIVFCELSSNVFFDFLHNLMFVKIFPERVHMFGCHFSLFPAGVQLAPAVLCELPVPVASSPVSAPVFPMFLNDSFFSIFHDAFYHVSCSLNVFHSVFLPLPVVLMFPRHIVSSTNYCVMSTPPSCTAVVSLSVFTLSRASQLPDRGTVHSVQH